MYLEIHLGRAATPLAAVSRNNIRRGTESAPYLVRLSHHSSLARREQAPQRFVDELRVRFAFRGLHHGTLEGVDRAVLAGLELGEGFRIRGDGVAAPLLELAGVGGRGLEAAPLGNGIR